MSIVYEVSVFRDYSSVVGRFVERAVDHKFFVETGFDPPPATGPVIDDVHVRAVLSVVATELWSSTASDYANYGCEVCRAIVARIEAIVRPPGGAYGTDRVTDTCIGAVYRRIGVGATGIGAQQGYRYAATSAVVVASALDVVRGVVPFPGAGCVKLVDP